MLWRVGSLSGGPWLVRWRSVGRSPFAVAHAQPSAWDSAVQQQSARTLAVSALYPTSFRGNEFPSSSARCLSTWNSGDPRSASFRSSGDFHGSSLIINPTGRWLHQPAAGCPGHSSVYALHNAVLHHQRRFLHVSPRRWEAAEEKSKVERTVEALKKDKQSKERVLQPPAVAGGSGGDSAVAAARTEEKALAAPPKKTLWQKVVAELKHYWHGFKLLAAETRISWGLLRKLLRGESLSRREHKQLVRTVSDLFRMVPFVVILAVPFAEFALPFLLKFFPNMLPSTFEEKSKKEESIRKKLKVKLEMAKFLQETIHETALEHQDQQKSTRAAEFAAFFDRIKGTGEEASTAEIMKFAKLFEDDLTLDNLPREVVVAMCRLLDIGTYGLPPEFLRFQLRMRLRNLRSDDKMIQREGIDKLDDEELQAACRARGMRSIGVSRQRLQAQLAQWIDLSLREEIPPSLLLLTRAMYLPDNLTTQEQLKTTLAQMPEKLGDEVEVKIAEEEGAKPDYEVKLRLVKEEQEAIKREEAERKEREAEEKAAGAVQTPSPVLAEVLLKTAQLKDVKPADVTKTDLQSVKPLVQEITKQDMEHIEDVIEKISKEKYSLLEQQDLKEEVQEYKEDIQELKQLPEASKLQESKAARRLTKRVDKMLTSMEKLMQDLETQKSDLKTEIKDDKAQLQQLQKAEDADRQRMLDMVDAMDQKKDNLLSIEHLMGTMRELGKVPDDARLARVEQVLRMLDINKDGNIELEHALKVIELIGEENFKISPKQMEEVMEVLRKEELLEDKDQQGAASNGAKDQDKETGGSANGQKGQGAAKNSPTPGPANGREP
ncbi:mitochondrial proton/calcium exchanger protein-like [Paramacrobiotus metropolitanus]|uniref:mitochondrial proton/calcium exchanger protein-like n=1 Tax=Paramacrobiotus metropolitanus TaxID=2943436 RepID=UPI002445C52A|nr:mitochondrial proton/calcium exchanger protein-like [Paramacrobiotus metropolitanus]